MRVARRLTVVLLILMAVVGVLIVAYSPETAPTRDSQATAGRPRPLGVRRTPLDPEPTAEVASTFLARPAEEEGERTLDSRELRKLVRETLVVLDLRAENGRPLREERGVLVDATGVVLARYRPLLGAYSGTCRIFGPREYRVEILGLTYRNEELDLALVRVSRSPVGYPLVPVLPGLPGETLNPDEPVYLDSGTRFVEAFPSELHYVSADGFPRLRVAEDGELPPDAFVALDPYGFLIGLCRLEVNGRLLPDSSPLPASGYRVLVDPAALVSGSLDADVPLSLLNLTQRFYEGTFTDLLQRGTVAFKQRRWREAIEFLEQALDRVALDMPEEGTADAARALLRESYLSETDRLLDEKDPAAAAELAIRATARFPEDPALLVRLAEARSHESNWEAAIDAFLRARALEDTVRLNSLIEDAYLRLVDQVARSNDVAAVENVLLAGIRDLPVSGPLHLELARLYVGLGAYNEAVALLNRVKDLSTSLREPADQLLRKIDDILSRRDAVIIPFDPDHRSIQTTAVIDGVKELTFIIDTGATYTTIPTEVVTALGYDLSRVPIEDTILVNTAAGPMRTIPVTLRSLNVGGYAVLNLRVLAIPRTTKEVFGLLGLNFLKNFTHSVDFKRGEFRLQRQ